ncbi:MAG: hypothetical protein EOP37_28625 [Rubrivivax sp.]|nr:MAG: hypothetical protein EOP37_28625 [Rubrivivax sp.]
MCRATTCRTCGKTTWAGCGQHIAAVKQDVPASQWCDGNHTRGEVEAAAAQRNSEGFLARLFGRGA